LLQRQPGVQIVTNGGPGSTTGVFLRGANAGQTLVLIDGLRVSSSSSGTTPFEAIPLDQIDHIEILRGPAASLYGSDAIGGVIQVFTRKGGDTFAANASAGYGTYNTSQFAAGASGGAAPGASWCRAVTTRAQASTPSAIPKLQLQPGPRRVSQWQRQRVAGLHVRSGTNSLPRAFTAA
jgi:vitamin B12 transporter